MPSPRREILLSNRLALASTLLYECSQILSGKTRASIPTLVHECELFFSETKSLLAAELSRETAEAESRTSAPPAEKSGAEFTPAPQIGWRRISPAEPAVFPTAEPDSAPALTSNPSHGGVIPVNPPDSQSSLIARIKLSFSTKPTPI